MISGTPRIEHVSATGPATLRVQWSGETTPVDVNLADWIATGGQTLAALNRRFQQGCNCGRAVLWNDSDLSIDAAHLMQLAKDTFR
jgi:hypothetical protein